MSIDHYLPHTPQEREEMLKEMGFGSVMELMAAAVPQALWSKRPLNLPEALSEEEVKELVSSIASLNRSDFKIFMGGGAYDAYAPAIVDHILLRPEFYTAYTPYQPEVSQGTLQAMFEYQSLVCRLTEMEVANASMYDGASALAEAVLMAFRVKKKGYKVALPKSLNPLWRRVVETYAHGLNPEIFDLEHNPETGQVKLESVEEALERGAVAVVVQHPNYFGVLEPVKEVAELAHSKDALFIVAFDPVSLGVLEPPGAYDADIAVAEGQPLGLPLSFGGPYLGIFTAKRQFIRQMPGRIAAETVDAEGKRGFVTTLQTREQHIRRERATSNICTNQQLIATAVAVYLSAVGKEGIQEIARQSIQKAHYLAEKLVATGKLELAFKGPFFREFAVRHKEKPAKEVVKKAAEAGFLVGPELPQLDERSFLIAVTERRKKEELDGLVEALSA